MRAAEDIILAPVITEASMDGIAAKVYTFRVLPAATKAEIATAVETLFKGTKVAKVNVINMKQKRNSRATGPKIRVPLISPWLLRSTTALSSKRM